MHRKEVTRFLAGMMSALLVLTSSGMEQLVYAAELETEVLQEETESTVEEADTEESEEASEADDSEQKNAPENEQNEAEMPENPGGGRS